jgi:ribulose 1,5-bisphosphate synthetase/thiazole synthase
MDEYCGHDVIVINGGSEGLGAYLGMAGRRVLVIDARDEGGGQGLAHTCWLRVRHCSALWV